MVSPKWLMLSHAVTPIGYSDAGRFKRGEMCRGQLPTRTCGHFSGRKPRKME